MGTLIRTIQMSFRAMAKIPKVDGEEKSLFDMEIRVSSKKGEPICIGGLETNSQLSSDYIVMIW